MDKLDIIITQLAEMRTEHKADREQLHGRLNKLFAEGCAKASSHADHEDRLRKVEIKARQVEGAVWLGVKLAAGISAAANIGPLLWRLLKQ